MKGYIEHEGRVIERNDASVTISIISASACASCHARGACTLSDKKEKIIDIHGKYNVSRGDKVTVLMSETLGYPAVILGYVLPLLIIIITLSIMINLSVPEARAGLFSILILIPYYILLRFFKSKIDKKFTFTLKL